MGFCPKWSIRGRHSLIRSEVLLSWLGRGQDAGASEPGSVYCRILTVGSLKGRFSEGFCVCIRAISLLLRIKTLVLSLVFSSKRQLLSQSSGIGGASEQKQPQRCAFYSCFPRNWISDLPPPPPHATDPPLDGRLASSLAWVEEICISDSVSRNSSMGSGEQASQGINPSPPPR